MSSRRAWRLALLLAVLLSPVDAPALEFVFSTSIAGDTVPVTLELVDAPGGDGVDVSVSIPTGEGDLLGLFGTVGDPSLLPGLSLEDASGLITQWQFAGGSVFRVGAGNTVSPVRNWDWAVRIENAGQADGPVESASFRIAGAGLDVNQLLARANAGWLFGVRIQSTNGPEGSAKIGASELLPRIRILDPADGDLVTTDPVRVSGSVEGNDLSVEVNGIPASVSGAAFEADVPVEDGPDTLTATASNDFGSASDEIEVIVDTTILAVVITAPADGARTQDSAILVNGTVESSSPLTSLTVGGVPIEPPASPFSALVALALGENEIVAEATDDNGNVAFDSVLVFRGEAPTVAIEAPVDGALLGASPVLVSGSVGGVPTPTLEVDGTPVPVLDGSFSTSVALAEGPGLVTASASNEFGDASDTVTVILDTTPPLVTIASPADGAEVGQQPIQVTGTVSDASPIVALSVNGVASAPGASFDASVALVEGANLITVEATDAAGNVGSASITVTFAGVVPLVISIDSPADGSVVSATPIDVSGSVSDPAATVTVGGVVATVSGGGYTASGIPLVEGTNTLTATATLGTDTASASVDVTLDTTSRARVVFLDPAACRLEARACVPFPVVAENVDEFAAALAAGGVGEAALSGPVDVIAVGERAFHAYVFASEAGPLSLGFDDPTGRLSVAESPRPSRPVAELASDLGEVGLDPGLATDLVPGDIAADYFARFDLMVSPAAGVFTRPPSAALYPGAKQLAGLAPQTPTLADVDRDGNLDLLVPNLDDGIQSKPTDDGVSLAFGRGDGTFSRPVQLPGGLKPMHVRVVDIDGDGELDLLIGNRNSAALEVLRGEGHGVFSLPFTGFFAAEWGFDDFELADMDGDGHLDAVTSATNRDAVGILLGNGDGTFESIAVFPAESDTFGIEVGDFDGDGAFDVATSGKLLRGNGAGGLGAPEDLGFALSDVDAADLDGDGNLDLVGRGLEQIVVFRGNGTGTFQTSTIAVPDLSTLLPLTDVDGDGALDLLVAAGPGLVETRLGDGAGGFEATPRLSAVSVRPSAGTHGAQMAVGDLNGDGLLDLVASEPSGGGSSDHVSVHLGNGDGTFGHGVFTTGSQSQDVAAADLDGDGVRDLVVANTLTNDLSILLGNGDGSFQPETRLPTAFGPNEIAVGDLDADGDLDLALTADLEVEVLLGDGSGGFAAGSVIADGLARRGIDLGDLDADGALDIVTGSAATDEVWVFRGAGDGSFDAGQPFPTLAGSRASVAVADMNLDGHLDVVSAGVSVVVLLGGGDGTLQPPFDPGIAPGLQQAIAVGDVNDDGIPDVAAARGFDQPTARSTLFRPAELYLGRGDGSFEGKLLMFPRAGSGRDSGQDVAIDDVNLDGAADIVIASSGGRDVLVYLGNGIGTFRFPDLVHSVAGLPVAMAVADLDGLNGPDIVTTSAISTHPSFLETEIGTVLLSRLPAGPTEPITLLGASADADDELELLLDLDGPRVRFSVPTPAFELSGATVSLRGTVGAGIGAPFFTAAALDVSEDGGGPLASDELSVAEGAFASTDLALGSGARCANVEAADLVGNFSTETVCFRTDPTAPPVRILTPVAGQSIYEPVDSPDAIFTRPTTLVSIDGGASGRTFDPGVATRIGTMLAFPVGPNTASYEFDAGEGSFVVPVTVNHVEPSVRITIREPSPGEDFNTDTITVTGWADHGTPRVTLNGIDAALRSVPAGLIFVTEHSTAGVPLVEGDNLLRVLEYGRGRWTGITVQKDIAPPSFLRVDPPDGSVVPAASVVLTGDVSEFAGVTASGPGGSTSADTVDVGGVQHFELPPLALVPGPNAIQLTAEDRAGNQTTQVHTIFQEAPQLSVVSPPDGSTLNALRTDVVVEATGALTIDAVVAAGRALPALAGLALPAGQSTLSDVPLVPGTNLISIVYTPPDGAQRLLAFSYESTALGVGGVAGVVSDASTGLPIPGATVRLGYGGITVSVQTDASGAYGTLVEPGAVSAQASAPGFGSASASTTALADRVVTLDFSLTAGAPAVTITDPAAGSLFGSTPITVSGTASDADQVTVNGAPVALSGGAFSVPVGLQEGLNPITAIATNAIGTATDTIQVVFSSGETSLVFGTIASAETGEPLAGALIEVVVGAETFTGMSAADGSYDVAGITPGDMSITYSLDEFTSQSFTVPGTGPLVVPLDVALEPFAASFTLTGTVISALSGLPEPDVEMTVLGTELATFSQADGSYTIGEFPIGAQTIRLQKEGYFDRFIDVTVDQAPPGGILTLDLDFPTAEGVSGGPVVGTTATGIVIDSRTAKPVVGALVEGGGVSDFSDETGAFTLIGLPTGSLEITASSADFADATLHVFVSPNATDSLEFRLVAASTGAIQGVVTDAASGNPIRFAHARVVGSDLLEAATLGDGAYTLSFVPVGEHALRVEHPAYLPLEIAGVSVAEGAVSPVDASLVPRPVTGAIDGLVRDADTGGPLAGAVVTLAGGGPTATTDSQGRFLLAGLPAGLVTLQIEAPGFLPADRTTSVVADSDPETPAVSQKVFELRADGSAPDAVTATVLAAEGATLVTPDERTRIVIPPGSLTGDAQITLLSPEVPTAVSGQPVDLDPALGVSDFVAVGRETEIRVAALVEGDPIPDLAGPVIFVMRYSEAEAAGADVDEGSLTPAVLDESVWNVLRFVEHAYAIDETNNIVITAQLFHSTETGSSVLASIADAEPVVLAQVGGDPPSGNPFKRFVTRIVGKIRSLVGAPDPMAVPNDLLIDPDTPEGFRERIATRSLPFLMFSGWSWASVAFNVEPDSKPFSQERYSQMIPDIFAESAVVYRPIFVANNSRASIRATAQAVISELTPILDSLEGDLFREPAENGVPGFGYSQGVIVLRTYQALAQGRAESFAAVGPVSSMITMGGPHHGAIQGLVNRFEEIPAAEQDPLATTPPDDPPPGIIGETILDLIRRWSPGTADLLDYRDSDGEGNPFLFALNRDEGSAGDTAMTMIGGTDRRYPPPLLGPVFPISIQEDFGDAVVGETSGRHDGAVPLFSALGRVQLGTAPPTEDVPSKSIDLFRFRNAKRFTEDFNHDQAGSAKQRIDGFSRRDIIDRLPPWGSSEVVAGLVECPDVDQTGQVTGISATYEWNSPLPEDIQFAAVVTYLLDGNDSWRIISGANPATGEIEDALDTREPVGGPNSADRTEGPLRVEPDAITLPALDLDDPATRIKAIHSVGLLQGEASFPDNVVPMDPSELLSFEPPNPSDPPRCPCPDPSAPACQLSSP